MSLANNKDEVEGEKIDDSLHNKRFQRSLLSSDQSNDDLCVKTIKKMQDLLNQFTKGHVLDTICKDKYIVRGFHYKQSILIETRSALPVHYTLTVEGEGKFGSFFLLFLPSAISQIS